MPEARLLTINTGSSSLKAGLYHFEPSPRLELAAEVDRIGLPGSGLRVTDARGTDLLDRKDDLPTHAAAVQALFAWLHVQGPASTWTPSGTGWSTAGESTDGRT
jgi:acetate kinase